MDNSNSGSIAVGFGIPSVVIGTLIALKKVGMTTMSYTDIIWFGVEVFLVCLAIAIAIWLIVIFIAALFGGYK